MADKNQMRKWSRAMRSQGKTIGLVPTMGYLLEGHISLIKEAHKRTNLIVVSVYVNPGQFSSIGDLSTYPSDFHGDIQKLMAVPGGVIFSRMFLALFFSMAFGVRRRLGDGVGGSGGFEEEEEMEYSFG